jgi:hypothetical protein
MANPERYATVQQLRDEGLPGDASTVTTDAQALILLERASQLVEQTTKGNLFYEVSGTYIFDGNNSYLLHMPLAIISVTSLTINGESSELDSESYRVYNNRVPPQDNRKNPKIELRKTGQPSIFTGLKSRKFLKGFDQTVVGSFGYLEADDSVPAVVNECVIAIVMMTHRSLYFRFGFDSGGGGGPGPVLGPLKRERTDDHETEWWQTDTAYTEIGLVVPQYVHGRLKMYRAPQKMVTQNFRFEPTEVNTNGN